MILAEEKLVKLVAGLPKPTQRSVYRKLGKVRLRLKKNYLLARANGEKNAIGDFLSSIGYNVSSSTMKGRTDEYEMSLRMMMTMTHLTGLYRMQILFWKNWTTRMYIIEENLVKRTNLGLVRNVHLVKQDSKTDLQLRNVMDVTLSHTTDNPVLNSAVTSRSSIAKYVNPLEKHKSPMKRHKGMMH